MTTNNINYWNLGNPVKGNSGEFGTNSGFGPAPRMLPFGNGSSILNIKDSHHWTESPVSSRTEVPVLKLTELKILSNPMLNQLANNIMVAIGSAARLGEDAAALGESAKESFNLIKTALTSTSSQDGNGANQSNQLKQQDEKLRQFISKTFLNATTRSETVGANHMKPYEFLYTVEPTKFKYILPYMENTYRSLSNSFGDSGENTPGIAGTVGSIAGIATEFMSSVSLRKMREPGIMIEKPKGFSFDGRERSYNVMFPLFNTKDYAEVVKNWQFLFLLIYQNTPNRISRDLIDPPCIYQASIPGVWYSKYSAITNMTVNFRGARRNMTIPFVSGGTTSEITTIIPDAYEVNMTVTELFAETQNFLFENIKINTDDSLSIKYKNEN